MLRFNILSNSKGSVHEPSIILIAYLQHLVYLVLLSSVDRLSNVLQISLPCEKDRSDFATCNTLQLILSFWQPFCLHFTEIFYICHFHSLFSMHTAFQLTYRGFLIIFFQEERQVKICFWLLYLIFQDIPTIFWMLETDREKMEVTQCQGTATCGWSSEQWLSLLLCIFCCLALSFLICYLHTSVSDWKRVSERIPDLFHFYK